MWKPGLPELLIILVLLLLLFGPGRIAKIAGELGSSVKSFRDGLNTEEKKEETKEEKPKSE